MKTEQQLWTKNDGWSVAAAGDLGGVPQLVLVFGGRAEVEDPARFNELKEFYPDSHILLCSTAGEILGTRVRDNSISATAIRFEKTEVKFAQTTIRENTESEAKGKEVAEQLPQEGLVHAMIFSDGLKVNGTALVSGILSVLPDNVSVTGGLVGDGADFKKTVVGLDGVPTEGNMILVGFYGSGLKVGYGSLGGWDPFGPDRTVTRSEGNVLYELDDKPALELYKEYLGDEAKGLPGTGLLFPLRIRVKEGGETVEVVRTLLAVDEEKQSMTFAGDIPKKATATLMKANFERLVEGAIGAAKMSGESLTDKAELAILISCIGRKLVLKEQIEEETEAVQSVIGKQAAMAGFYSYGEICPTAATEKQCRLHNQTMTITTFREE